jgi:hypothetical protein
LNFSNFFELSFFLSDLKYYNPLPRRDSISRPISPVSFAAGGDVTTRPNGILKLSFQLKAHGGIQPTSFIFLQTESFTEKKESETSSLASRLDSREALVAALMKSVEAKTAQIESKESELAQVKEKVPF